MDHSACKSARHSATREQDAHLVSMEQVSV
jgi:hypothetical protein